MHDWPDIWTLLDDAKASAPLATSSIHGERHWHEVARVGLQIARRVRNVDPYAILLFAMFHDSRRESEEEDPGHGRRGADALRAAFSPLGLLPPSAERAIAACALHDIDHVERHDTTIGSCHDADRLLLGRVGVEPDSRFLMTDIARQHASGAALLMMPEPDEALAWGQRWLVAARMQERPRS
jgi:uncharacterized protein